jgi:hypothetical protein
MITIKKDVWRAECIASIGLDETNLWIKVFPVNCDDYIGYQYETIEEAEVIYKNILLAWQFEIKERYHYRLSG